MRRASIALLLAGFALGTAACGSGDDGDAGSGSTTSGSPYVTTSGADTPFTADDVEEAVAADGQTGGAVDLDGNSPKSITCEQDKGPTAWRCRISSGEGGRTIICIVAVDETTRAVTKRSCGALDN
jgi:hypothetical protein